MFKVISKKGFILVNSLDEAMKYAKILDEFVTIQGKDFEVCGKFGVDAVEHATLPNGESYTWTMRRDGTHRSWRKKLG